MAAGDFRIRSSIRRPLVFTMANWPPTTLELPGPIMAAVIPARTASSKAASMGLIPSIARRAGVRGSTVSLQSSPSVLFFSSMIPIWQCASMMPGMISAFFAITTCSPSSGCNFTSPLAPTCAIFPFLICRIPSGISLPAMVRILPPTIYISGTMPPRSPVPRCGSEQSIRCFLRRCSISWALPHCRWCRRDSHRNSLSL